MAKNEENDDSMGVGEETGEGNMHCLISLIRQIAAFDFIVISCFERPSLKNS